MVQLQLLATVALALLALSSAGCINENFIKTGNEAASSSSNEMETTTNMYTKLKEEIKVLEQLKHSLEMQIKEQNSKLVANSMCAVGNAREVRDILQSHLNRYSLKYDEQLMDNIFREAMAQIYGCKNTSQWADIFGSLSQVDELKIFDLLLQSQLHFYENHDVENQHVNSSNFQPKFYLNLHKLKQAKLYESVRESLRQRVDELVRKLPTALQYLLFYPHFCLMNSKYPEYIYTSLAKNNLDATSRYVWVWYEQWFIDDSGHIKANVSESSAGQLSQLSVQLKGTTFDIFYYRMPETNLVAAWDLPSEPVNTIWNIEFVDNERVVFSQDDYLMCSTEEKHDQERRSVRGYKRGKYTSKSSECQWLLGKCDRRT